MLRSYMTPVKFQSPLKGQSPILRRSPDQEPRYLSTADIKSFELQAISLIDSDLAASKLLIERCLRQIDEQAFPVLENV